MCVYVCVVQKKMTVVVVPGVGVKVAPSAVTATKLRGLCATNSSFSSPEDRLFGKDLDFHLLDEFDNQADFSEQTVLVCSINGQGIDPGHPALPQLTRRQDVHDQFTSNLVGERVSQSTFKFKAISLAPCSEEASDGQVLDGELSLVFKLRPREGGFGAIIDDVMAWECPFVFTSDHGRALKERACKEELEPLLTDLSDLQERKRVVKDKLCKVENGLKRALVNYRASEITLQDVSYLLPLVDVLIVWG
jgi:hypothetical protein